MPILRFTRFMILALTFSAGLTGCTSLFFHPTKTRYPFLELDKLIAEPVKLKSKDGTTLSAWRLSSVKNREIRSDLPRPKDLKPNEVRGIALQFHGNAENMTTHYRFLAWMLLEGWDVLTFDYRGYGDSDGKPERLSGILEDGIAALEWGNKIAKEKGLPLVVFGQSLGGSIALRSIMAAPPSEVKLLVIDSSFYSFTSIAREKLASVWFLWPFQGLGWLFVSNELSAGPLLAKAQGLPPAIFLHSMNDPVVSYRQGSMLYAEYPTTKEMWTTDEPGHVNSLFADAGPENEKGADPREYKLRLKLKQKLRALTPVASKDVRSSK